MVMWSNEKYWIEARYPPNEGPFSGVQPAIGAYLATERFGRKFNGKYTVKDNCNYRENSYMGYLMLSDIEKRNLKKILELIMTVDDGFKPLVVSYNKMGTEPCGNGACKKS